MTLLEDIIDGASGEGEVPGLLRKLKVLAMRTDADRLAAWVDRELDGYKNDDEIPSYRGPFNLHVLGHFFGIAGSELKDYPIPPMTFPTELRESVLFLLTLRVSIAKISSMATQEIVNFAWPADTVLAYNMGVKSGHIRRIVQEDMILGTANCPIARQVLVGVLEAVRNRILDLALELEKAAPEAGQAATPSEAKEEAAQVINNYNFYATSNVAINSSDFEQTVQAGDRESLFQALRAIGANDDQMAELQSALTADQQDPESAKKGSPGRRVLTWMAGASTQIGTGASGDLIAEAIKGYFGG